MIRRHTRTRQLAALAAATCVTAGAALVYCFEPTEGSFYPRCVFHQLTGLHCPGCGGTRCLHALLHGDLAQAAAYNLLLVLLVPFLGYGVGRALWHALAGTTPVFGCRLPAWGVRALGVLLLLFWLLRNLPFAPFGWLAPHKL